MKIGIVILAAGAGSRLGGAAKALLPIGDTTFLGRILAIAREVGLADAVVVVGPPHGTVIALHTNELDVRVVVNDEPERGMASSVALGFRAIAETDCDAAWLWPVDHPSVEPDTLRALIAALGSHDVVQPRFGDRGGHPPLVARAVWPRFAACESLPEGARSVLAEVDVVGVTVPDAGVVQDVDTPDHAKALL